MVRVHFCHRVVCLLIADHCLTDVFCALASGVVLCSKRLLFQAFSHLEFNLKVHTFS